jgi:hypothetical protein
MTSNVSIADIAEILSNGIVSIHMNRSSSYSGGGLKSFWECSKQQSVNEWMIIWDIKRKEKLLRMIDVINFRVAFKYEVSLLADWIVAPFLRPDANCLVNILNSHCHISKFPLRLISFFCVCSISLVAILRVRGASCTRSLHFVLYSCDEVNQCEACWWLSCSCPQWQFIWKICLSEIDFLW